MIELLLEKGANVNYASSYNLSTDLHLVLHRAQEKFAMMLLIAGIDVKILDRCPKSFLYVASRQGFTNIVKILLEKGVDVNRNNNKQEDGRRTTLAMACAKGHEDTIRLLVNSGADVNEWDTKYGTALIVAANYNRYKIIQILYEAKALVNLSVDFYVSSASPGLF